MKKEFQEEVLLPVAKSESERDAVLKFHDASHQYIDNIIDVLTSDSINPINEEIELVYHDLYKIIRNIKIAVHPIVYEEICEFRDEVFEGVFSNKPVLEQLKTLNDWLSAIQNLRNYFEYFTDEVLMPYLWG